MKNITLVCAVIFALCLGGCGKSDEQKRKEADEQLLKGDSVKKQKHEAF